MLNISEILDMYDNQGCSTYVIAKKFGTYPNKIRRLLLKHGKQLDDKSTAQKKALAAGRSVHPTEGKKRSPEVKEQISESVYQHWQNLTDAERRKRSEQAKQQWENMTELERQELQDSAAQAVRDAAKKGSKMERFLLDKLTSEGYNVIFHKTGLLANTDLEIDLFIPELKTAIEIDGPAHFFPIWGEESLQKHIKADAEKSGLLLSQGFVVIRVKHLTKNLSEKHKRDVLSRIIEELGKVRKKFPTKGKRYLEIEVT
jgi:very-short-patch-repair endonuclease